MDMSKAIRILQGRFGRVSLLDMSKSLVNHAHRQCHIIIKVSGSDCAFHVRGRNQPLVDESAVLVNAWEPHSYEHTPGGEGRSILLALYLEPVWLSEIVPSLSVSGHPRFFPEPCIVLPKGARRLVNILATKMLVSQDISADELEGKIFDLFIATVENNSYFKDHTRLIKSTPKQDVDRRLRRILDRIKANCSENFDLSELASESGLSRAHFFHLFKQDLNVTPVVYINSLRIELAIEKLSDVGSTITDVSYEVGFSAPSHFTRFFRQHLGITPSDYRHAVDLLAERTNMQS